MSDENVEVKALKDVLDKTHAELKQFMLKADEELRSHGKEQKDTIKALEDVGAKAQEVGHRIDKLEAKLNRGGHPGEFKSLGDRVVDSEEYKAAVAADRPSFKFRLSGAEYKTAIINTTGQNQPLVPSDRQAGIIAEPNRALRIRDLPQANRTNSNLIEYTKENVFTNSAAVQAGNSPTEFENVTKAESGITFTLESTPVTTLAHFIPVSRQVLSDAPALQSYVDGRLRYGLKYVEDDQLLNGSGNSGNLKGLWTFRTAFSRANSGDTKIDTIRRAMTQTFLSNYSPDAVVLHPSDWEDIELTKDTQGRYIWASPSGMLGARIWGLPVVQTLAQTATRFLVGAFKMSATVWDREDMSVRMSEHNGTDFVKNMVTLLAEERLAQTIERPSGIVGGTF